MTSHKPKTTSTEIGLGSELSSSEFENLRVTSAELLTLPTNSNGKTNIRAQDTLIEEMIGRATGAKKTPELITDVVERTVQILWANVLGLERLFPYTRST